VDTVVGPGQKPIEVGVRGMQRNTELPLLNDDVIISCGKMAPAPLSPVNSFILDGFGVNVPSLSGARSDKWSLSLSLSLRYA